MPDTPQVCPGPVDLDLLELVRNGAYRPTNDRPARFDDALTGPSIATVELVDPEGVPLARVPVEVVGGQQRVTMRRTPHWLGRISTRPFEHLYRWPDEVKAASLSGADVILVNRPLTEADLTGIPSGRSVILMVLAGPSADPTAATLGLLHSAYQLATQREDVQAIAVPMDVGRSETDPGLYSTVLNAYAPHGYRRLDSNQPSRPYSPGLVLFFTGLSGSGKSTIARAVRNAILEQYGRTVSLLDGDVVRRTLSTGLGFSPTDRETNVLRIGWVAATVAHHGGIAICSPIAPSEPIRQLVRATVAEKGGQFVLIHVATPLKVCERRDRKGLYAKARAGKIPDFTGISAPYDEPTGADLVLDTTALTVDRAQESVLAFLRSHGLLKLPAAPSDER